MKIHIENSQVIRTLLSADDIMKRHCGEASILFYSDEGIKIYSSVTGLIASYNLLPKRLEVLNSFINGKL